MEKGVRILDVRTESKTNKKGNRETTLETIKNDQGYEGPERHTARRSGYKKDIDSAENPSREDEKEASVLVHPTKDYRG